MLPLALKVTGKRVLVVGAGRVGVAKASLLVEAGALVTMIAREALVALPTGLASFDERDFRDGDTHGYALVVSATGNDVVNDRIVEETGREGIWLNVVDDPSRSDFYFTAVYRAGDVTVSVSTEGASPALAQEIRTRIAATLPSNLADIARQLRRERAALHDDATSTEGVDWRPHIRELLGSDEQLH